MNQEVTGLSLGQKRMCFIWFILKMKEKLEIRKIHKMDSEIREKYRRI